MGQKDTSESDGGNVYFNTVKTIYDDIGLWENSVLLELTDVHQCALPPSMPVSTRMVHKVKALLPMQNEMLLQTEILLPFIKYYTLCHYQSEMLSRCFRLGGLR